MSKRFNTFGEFYPFYLSEHTNRTCRRLHFIGSALVLALLAAAIFRSPWFLAATPLCGYGFAWTGHIFFEKNRPATFTYPLFSFIGDWVMFKDIVIGKIKF